METILQNLQPSLLLPSDWVMSCGVYMTEQNQCFVDCFVIILLLRLLVILTTKLLLFP